MTNKVNIVWDSTILDAYSNCAQYFDYRHNKNKTTITKAKPLDQGSVMHHGFEAYYKGLKESLPFEKCLDDGLKSIRVALTDSDLDSQQGDRCLAVMEENVIRWRIEDRGWMITAVEQPFSFLLHEDELLRIIMIGKIDLLWSNHQYENLPVDHKTYERDFELSRLANQFTCYTYATNSNFLLVNRVGFQTSIKPEIKHKRVMLSYDPIFKEQWKRNVVRWAYMYYDSCTENSWPMNPTSCFKFNRSCVYKDVCETTGEENKIYKLQTNFATVDPWDVSKALTSKG